VPLVAKAFKVSSATQGLPVQLGLLGSLALRDRRVRQVLLEMMALLEVQALRGPRARPV
jgi:hypothetical protein